MRLLFILLVMLLTSEAGAATYYVAKTGNDTTGDGSLSTPWLTIQKAASTVVAGDTVFVRTGTYQEYVTVSADGTSGSRITFEAYPNEFPIIDGSGLTAPTSSNLFRAQGDYITLRGFELINAAMNSVLCDGSNCLIENNIIHGGYQTGIYLFASSNNTVRGNIVYDMYDFNNAGGNADCITSTDGGSGNLIERNIVHDCSDDGIDSWGTTGNTYRNNISYHNGYEPFTETAAGDGSGFKIGGNGGGGHTVIDNIAYLNRLDGFNDNTGTNNTVLNNTAISSNVNYTFSGAGNVLRNNISQGGTLSIANATEQTNSWDLSITDALFANSTTPTHESFGRLTSSSPAIGVGTTVGGSTHPCVGNCDIGAREFTCSGSSPSRTAYSPSFGDVYDCLQIANDGDTITIPAGSAIWYSLLDWSNKSVTLKGNGIGSTIISAHNLNGTYPCLMNITAKATGGSPAGLTRITGITFAASTSCGDNTPNTPDGMINIKGDTANFRFDHNRMESGQFSGGLTFQEYVRGVVDHNEFVSLAPTVNRKSVVCWHTKWDTTTLDFGGSSWAKPSTVGTINQLFFEDNNFDRSTSPNGLNAYNDEYAGCRSTHRFNTMTNSHAATHGLETSQFIRAVRHVEYYRNFTPTHPLVQDSAYKYRDGTGMIFDNVVTPNIGTRFGALDTLRREDDGSHSSGTWFPWKACGDHGTVVSITRSGSTATVVMSQLPYVPAQGAWIKVEGADQAEYNGTFFATGTTPDVTFTFTYTVSGTPATPATGTITVRSPFDGNTDTTGYPCMDQIGRGQGVLFVGTGSNMTPTTAANQASEPLYCFNNTIAGVQRDCEPTYGADVIVENRDYYNASRGARSARPATCTTGEAYWSTDGGGNWNTSTTETYSATPGEDGGLDKCTATNTWTDDWYVPPTYPHALVTLLDTEEDGGNGVPLDEEMYFLSWAFH